MCCIAGIQGKICLQKNHRKLKTISCKMMKFANWRFLTLSLAAIGAFCHTSLEMQITLKSAEKKVLLYLMLVLKSQSYLT